MTSSISDQTDASLDVDIMKMKENEHTLTTVSMNYMNNTIQQGKI